MVSKAIINPAMMNWARRYAGFIGEYEELLPKYIKKHYKLWERGEKYPTWNQLRQVSNKYNVPTAFFFMETEPVFDDLPTLIDFRKINSNNKTPELIKEIHKSEHRREIYLDLLFELNKPIPKFEIIGETKSQKNVVKYIGEKLGLHLDKQKSEINKIANNLNKWKELITEKMGILIFETDEINLEEMKGLCIFHDKIPIILLNGKNTTKGKIFSLFHELSHLLLGKSAICENNELSDEENLCNGVASEFLVPEDDIHTISTDETLKEFSASKSKNQDAKYFNNMIKYNSESYCTIVLEAYENGIITSGEFSKFTKLKKKDISKLQKRIYEIKT